MKTKSILAGLAAAVVLLAGCSTATPVAQTITQSVPTTVLKTVVTTQQQTTTKTSTATETETETSVSTAVKSVPTTVVRTAVKTVPQTVNVTVTAEPAGDAVPNGDYLVGKDIEPGTYQCQGGGENLYWSAEDSSGEIIDNDLGSIARFTSAAYTIKMDGCSGDWKRVG